MIRQLWQMLPRSLKEPVAEIRHHLGGERVIFRAESPYNRLCVVDKKGYRYLVFDDGERPGRRQRPELVYQSCMPLNGPGDGRDAYACCFTLAWVFYPSLKRVCMIGLGGGVVVRQFLRDHPDLSFTTVEIDPVVVEVAYRFFGLPRDSRHRVVVEEGRRFMDTCTECYDLVLLDAFFSRSVPHCLFTREFFGSARSRLSPAGLLGINFNGALTGPKSIPFRRVYKTVTGVFPAVCLFASKKETPREMQNLVIFALQQPRAPDGDGHRWREGGLAAGASRFYSGPVAVEDVAELADADAPPGGKLPLYQEKL